MFPKLRLDKGTRRTPRRTELRVFGAFDVSGHDTICHLYGAADAHFWLSLWGTPVASRGGRAGMPGTSLRRPGCPPTEWPSPECECCRGGETCKDVHGVVLTSELYGDRGDSRGSVTVQRFFRISSSSHSSDTECDEQKSKGFVASAETEGGVPSMRARSTVPGLPLPPPQCPLGGFCVHLSPACGSLCRVVTPQCSSHL